MKHQNNHRLPLLAVLLMLLGTSLTAGAYDFIYNNVYYIITSTANKTVKVTQRPGKYNGPYTIPATVPYNGSTWTVTAIGDSAFYDCGELSRCTLPNTIKTIGKRAFMKCKVLPSVALYDGLTSIGESAFENCAQLASITLPSTVTSVGMCAFFNCDALASVTWSQNAKKIPNYAFYSCDALKNFNFLDGLTEIGDQAFAYSALEQALLPYGLKSLTGSVFSNCAELRTLLIPSSVTSMGSMAFTGCSKLSELYCNMKTAPSINISNVPATCKAYVPVGAVSAYNNAGWNAMAVQEGAFDFNYGTGYVGSSTYHMTVLSDQPVTYDGVTYAGTAAYVYHPNIRSGTFESFTGDVYETDNMCRSGKRYLMTEVGDYCFYKATNLKSAKFKSSMNVIGNYAFQQCANLQTVDLGSGLTAIYWHAFEYCSSLKEVSIPNTVTWMSQWAFANCAQLDNVNWTTNMDYIPEHCFDNSGMRNFKMPYWIKTIDKGAFANIKKSNEMILPYGLTKIWDDAFSGAAINKVLIPSSVTSIGSTAFKNCTSLKDIYINMPTAPSMDFTNVPSSCKMYVPVGKVGQYKATSGWSGHTSNVTAGAYDYNFGSDGYNAGSLYHMTITSTTPVTYNGTAYAGTAKYVYHPNISTTQVTGYGASLYETDDMCGSGKKYLITEIGDSAFANMASGIAKLDFSNCKKLTKVGNYAFQNANGLETVILPEGVTHIGQEAYGYLKKMTSVTIPNTVTSMGSYMFYGCSSLSSVNWSTGMTTIPQSTFSQCASLKDFVIPHWITSVGRWAFLNSGLKQAVMPYGLKTISANAFMETPVTVVLVPSSVTSMASSAFEGCSSMTEFYCNMSTAPSMDFSSMPSSCKFYVPVNMVKQYKGTGGWSGHNVEAGAYDFNFGTGYNAQSNYHMTVISSQPVTFDGVTYAGTAMYVFHPNITTTTSASFSPELCEIDNMCSSGKKYLIAAIGDSAFYGSSPSITSLSFEQCKALTRLGHDAFWTSKVKTLKLPASVSEYGKFAIYYLPDLTDLYIARPTPASVPVNCFYGPDQARVTLHVPTPQAVALYGKANYWKSFYNIVSEGAGVPGDVNGDGEVNISDVNAVIDIILGGGTNPAADVNGDGEVNIGDVNAVIDIILG